MMREWLVFSYVFLIPTISLFLYRKDIRYCYAIGSTKVTGFIKGSRKEKV